jgi:hypothetical protein
MLASLQHASTRVRCSTDLGRCRRPGTIAIWLVSQDGLQPQHLTQHSGLRRLKQHLKAKTEGGVHLLVPS